MSRFRIRYSRRSENDLDRLTRFLSGNTSRADEAEDTIRYATSVLERLPFIGRPARGQKSLALRELVVPFAKTGYAILYRVGPGKLVSVLAVRHQLEATYH